MDNRTMELSSIIGDIQIGLGRTQDAWKASKEGQDPKGYLIDAGETLDLCKERIRMLLQW